MYLPDVLDVLVPTRIVDLSIILLHGQGRDESAEHAPLVVFWDPRHKVANIQGYIHHDPTKIIYRVGSLCISDWIDVMRLSYFTRYAEQV